MKVSSKHTSNKEQTDEELLLLYRQTGNTEHFGMLYNRYLPLVYGVCLKYLQHEANAQDAVMEIFEKLLPRIGEYDIKEFRTWLYSVVKNHCFYLLRDKKREINIAYDSNIMESDEVLTLFNSDESNEQEAVLRKCLENLPDPQRITVAKFFYEELSYVEIVDVTGYHLKSVKSYIQNGKRNLKICMEKNEVVLS